MNTLREDTTSATAEDAPALRAAMVEDLRNHGELGTDKVAAAFATVPREVFASGAPLERSTTGP